MTEVEQFVTRLSEALGNRSRHATNNDYVMTGDLQRAIALALVPPGEASDEFPLMLYRDRHSIIVNDRNQEAQAAAEGYTRTPPPQYEEGFPKYFVERPKSEGGWKVYGNRRVTILTPTEEAQFHAAVKEDDWIADPVSNPHGARGVSLAAVIAERKEMLKAAIDAQPLVASDATAPAAEAVITPAPDDAEAR